MTPEAQRIAIAEACVWTKIRWLERIFYSAGSDPEGAYLVGNPPHAKSEEKEWRWSLPDYLNDLNAMHEAEKVLTKPEEWSSYTQSLHLISWKERHIEQCKIEIHSRAIIHATAAQRAEAFLKAIGKWEESST